MKSRMYDDNNETSRRGNRQPLTVKGKTGGLCFQYVDLQGRKESFFFRSDNNIVDKDGGVVGSLKVLDIGTAWNCHVAAVCKPEGQRICLFIGKNNPNTNTNPNAHANANANELYRQMQDNEAESFLYFGNPPKPEDYASFEDFNRRSITQAVPVVPVTGRINLGGEYHFTSNAFSAKSPSFLTTSIECDSTLGGPLAFGVELSRIAWAETLERHHAQGLFAKAKVGLRHALLWTLRLLVFVARESPIYVAIGVVGALMFLVTVFGFGAAVTCIFLLFFCLVGGGLYYVTRNDD